MTDEWEWHGKPKRQVFAVVRVDPEWLGVSTPGENAGEGLEGVIIQGVLPTAEDARAETKRLNALNGSKGCAYFWLDTRYYPEGRKVTEALDD